jgi:hypothetical protein
MPNCNNFRFFLPRQTSTENLYATDAFVPHKSSPGGHPDFEGLIGGDADEEQCREESSGESNPFRGAVMEESQRGRDSKKDCNHSLGDTYTDMRKRKRVEKTCMRLVSFDGGKKLLVGSKKLLLIGIKKLLVGSKKLLLIGSKKLFLCGKLLLIGSKKLFLCGKLSKKLLVGSKKLLLIGSKKLFLCGKLLLIGSKKLFLCGMLNKKLLVGSKKPSKLR